MMLSVLSGLMLLTKYSQLWQKRWGILPYVAPSVCQPAAKPEALGFGTNHPLMPPPVKRFFLTDFNILILLASIVDKHLCLWTMSLVEKVENVFSLKKKLNHNICIRLRICSHSLELVWLRVSAVFTHFELDSVVLRQVVLTQGHSRFPAGFQQQRSTHPEPAYVI